ncbi:MULTISPECIES: carbohydrate ABC transporter permease [Micromonospora]|uniref:ABC transporter permease n=1 Tax=Micromonospora maris TaxID=1003110 RepID=A0A9X0I023_9ACTN|nr:MULTISPECIES: sugar ABC transporter permease [Micromonospora]AEB44828.1 binding-protein-dependent transport systems inner membrane component [Micromonospora maris AB-18-032]KUJ44298.1 ABC transporter permease [Micromonospora maris]RUL92142.1 sugar ABC transporter permease [Verrucosispora sp. FIM060022]
MSVTAPSRPPGAATRRRTRPRGRQALLGWLYATPTAVFVALLFAVPLLLVIRMSLSKWSLLRGDQGINAPDNFVKAVDHRFFTESVVFTLKYTALATALLLALGLGLALLVQESSRWNNLLRASFLIPSALGLASASLLFYVLYSPYASPLAPVMDRLGLTFLGSPTAALISTTFLIVWRYAGFYMVLMLVGLQGIPADVYEAARTDGASRWQTFRKVTLPLLRPTLALTTVLCVTGSLLAFEQFYILTKGGPDNSTITVVQLIYMVAFQGQNDLGVAAAISVIVLLALILINALQMRAFRSEES